jgi:starch phosphorylase
MLQQLGIRYRLIHLNEGHAAFALLERIRDGLQEGLSFEAAREAVRKTTVFTTHTPVPAGHDVFPYDLMEKYFHPYWADLGLDRDRFFKLGGHPRKAPDGFNMTVLALNLSDHSNAVSQRHGEVSREMWRDLWPEKPSMRSPSDPSPTGSTSAPGWNRR